MIVVDRVTARYGNQKALEGLDLRVEPGAVFALLGRNGAGKTTLLKLLLGHRRPDAGQVQVFGADPWRQRARLMARIGATPEHPDAPPDLTVARLEASVSALHARWDRAGTAERWRRFGIDRRLRFEALSRGQRALVMLTLALGHAPELLLLDDPTLGLDAVARRSFYEELVVDLADRGTTVFLATHDLDGVERVASHVGILSAGRLVAGGALETIRGAAPLEETFVALTGAERAAP